MPNMENDAFEWAFRDILERYEAAKASAKKDRNDFNDGYEQGYSEVVDIITNRLDVFGINLKPTEKE